MPRETILLLPGMMCDARLFEPQIAWLERDYDVIVPELVEPSIDAMARSVLAGAPPGPLNVAGLSMGGIVAMAMAAMAPERIVRLGLIDTNHLADAPERYDVRNRQIADVEAGRLRDVIIEEMKPVYLAEKNRGNQELLNLLVDMAMDIGSDMFVAQSVALRDRPDQSEALRAYGGPALVLCGEEDQLCPPDRHGEIAAMLDNSQIVLVPGAGHISTLENPLAVNDAIRKWLRRYPGVQEDDGQ